MKKLYWRFKSWFYNYRHWEVNSHNDCYVPDYKFFQIEFEYKFGHVLGNIVATQLEKKTPINEEIIEKLRSGANKSLTDTFEKLGRNPVIYRGD
jgi:hypothetical protein